MPNRNHWGFQDSTSKTAGTRGMRLWSKYKLTNEAYQVLLESQRFKCKICDLEPGKQKNLCVDHDHKTGLIRGLLCESCNKLLGFAKDNPTLLLKAIQYLKGNL